ncbi:MAG: DUF4922 domain-containing protein [Dysgonamonadaceae bacterium]|jgi:glycosyltransferase involved in cell wall biosynthesis|nr:DUF4922 domain-containing protein [Dysgonamonadaceae bacterium]
MSISHITHGERDLRNAIELKKKIAEISTEYFFLYLHNKPIEWTKGAQEKLLQTAQTTGAGMIYSDRYKIINGEIKPYPVNNYQPGSLRDDFDFGGVMLYKTSIAQKAVAQIDENYQYAALYALRLQVFHLSEIIHVPEFLYTEPEIPVNNLFAYVDPKNRAVQIEMERACTEYLKMTGAYLPPVFQKVDLSEGHFPVEASVVIPVRNREKTIEQAVRSALAQKTSFPFNILVIDNHSTDRTTEILQRLAAEESRVIHLIPQATDSGIGGCWNLAINDLHCGRFAVQLDSDDLYIDKNVLQKIVNAFYEQQCPMIIGSYRMVNFQLEEIPPGLIDHREWTLENGRNNALRINGLGAPRAFYTPVIREIQFPNVSYGEDYAVGLAISRRYTIGRIYEALYLCRRWEDNSDANPDITRLNAYNQYKDRVRTMELLTRISLPSLASVKTHTFDFQGYKIKMQFNPVRVRSANANVDPTALKERKCVLCAENRPPEQKGINFLHYTILLNPYPIFPVHLTIVEQHHVPQSIRGRLPDFFRLSDLLPDFTLLYNGPKSGASLPDHFHFQAGNKGFLPVEQDVYSFPGKKCLQSEADGKVYCMENYGRQCIVLESAQEAWLLHKFDSLLEIMQRIQPQETEPMMNLITWKNKDLRQLVIFPRRQHRPQQFYAGGDQQILVSPGVVDFGGALIVVREEDFEKIDADLLQNIYAQLTYSDDEMQILLNQLIQS